MGERLSRDVTIVNERGLHARPAGMIVQLCERFDAEAELRFNGETADALSIHDLMILAAPSGSTLTVETWGDQAADLLDAIDTLISAGFDDKR